MKFLDINKQRNKLRTRRESLGRGGERYQASMMTVLVERFEAVSCDASDPSSSTAPSLTCFPPLLGLFASSGGAASSCRSPLTLAGLPRFPAAEEDSTAFLSPGFTFLEDSAFLAAFSACFPAAGLLAGATFFLLGGMAAVPRCHGRFSDSVGGGIVRNEASAEKMETGRYGERVMCRSDKCQAATLRSRQNRTRLNCAFGIRTRAFSGF